MKIINKDLHNLDKTGIYQIKCLVTNKLYIGHTKKSFYSRYKSHYEKLRTNNHKAYHYLQNSVNKYGIDKFEFSIIEICSIEICIKKETYWINYYKSYEKEFGYNINRNPENSPMLNNESKQRMINTLTEGYKSGRIKLNQGIFKKGIQVWNKGRKYESTNHLKVPKKKKGSRLNFSNNLRNKLPKIDVFLQNGIFINTWNSAKDLQDDSLSENFILKPYFIFRNPNGRNGFSPYLLQSVNINKSCKINKIYKGFVFKYNNQALIKQEELLENPTLERQKEDNQQPILSSNTFEGSTTNTQIPLMKIKDSNGNTSILHPIDKQSSINYAKWRKECDYRMLYGDDIV